MPEFGDLNYSCKAENLAYLSDFLNAADTQRHLRYLVEIMVPRIRVRVSPLCFYTFLGKILDSTEATMRRALLLTQHNRYHNGHSPLVSREEIVEAHCGLAVPGGGDVGEGVGGLRDRERQEFTV